MTHERARALFFALMTGISLSSCAGQTVIKYQERYACNQVTDSGETGPNLGGVPPGHYFDIFTIIGLDNTSKGAKDFIFDPAKLFVLDENKVKVFHRVQGKIADKNLLKPIKVKAGENPTYLGRVSFDVADATYSQDKKVVDPRNLYYDDSKSGVPLRSGSDGPANLGVCDIANLALDAKNQ